MMLYQKDSLHVGDSSIALPRQYICYFQLFSKRSHLWIDQVLLQGSLIICLDPINIYSVFKTFKVSLLTMPCCSSIRDAASCGSRFSIISMHSYGSLHAYQKLTKAAQVSSPRKLHIGFRGTFSERMDGQMDEWLADPYTKTNFKRNIITLNTIPCEQTTNTARSQ